MSGAAVFAAQEAAAFFMPLPTAVWAGGAGTAADRAAPRRPAWGPAAAPLPGGGTLLVPDFDAPPPDAAEAAARAAATAEVRADAARAEGFAAGEAAGRAAAARAHAAERATAEAAALAAAAAALDGQEAAARAAVEEGATALAALLLAALDAALPAAAARLAADSAALLAEAVRPALEACGAATLHVPPGLGAEVAARLSDPRLAVAEDSALPPGDARATWRGGGAVSALAERRRAVAEVLAALGLGAAGDDEREGDTA